LHHHHQTEGGLTRWASLDSGEQLTDLRGRQYKMAEECTEKLIEKVQEYVFLYDTCHPGYKNFVKKAEAKAFPLFNDFVHPLPPPFSFTTQC
jgi:hypothetical protein